MGSPLSSATAFGKWANIPGDAVNYKEFVEKGTSLHDFLLNITGECEDCSIHTSTNAQWIDPYVAIWAVWQFEMLVNGSSSPTLVYLTNSGAYQSFLKSCNEAGNNVIEWIMGRNPSRICMIESLGLKNIPLYRIMPA